MTTLADFGHEAAPPAGFGLAQQALWWSRRQDWERAHACVQQNEGDPACDWVHAHLHRVEGDGTNAAYWYRRAGKPIATGSLEAEWTAIATAIMPAEDAA